MKLKSEEILELVHSDVCGPLDVNSAGCSKYVLTFIDDFSNYPLVYTNKELTWS